MKIWANTIVHNEENFIWFAISSVVNFVDKVLIYDTGSTDKTVRIIDELVKKYGSKIEFKEVGDVNDKEFPKIRQQMLDQSKCDWILVLDGDEIWWEESIKKLIEVINQKGKSIEGIVVPFIAPVGDIYHFQEAQAGQYQLLGRKGHYSLRAINKKIPGLHVGLPYGKEGYFDINNKLIHEREKVFFLDAPYLHVTQLKRSNSPRKYNKFKYELGESFPVNFKFPEVLLKPFPDVVSSPWGKISGVKKIWAQLLTPLRKIKRRLK